MRVAAPYEPRFIRAAEARYVTQCWHASKAYHPGNRHARLLYVVRQFVRKYPEYDGRTTAVYKDVDGLLEYAT
jgi:hypothetical protein